MTGWNEIAVEKVGATSRLVQCIGFPPIKFINPRPQSGCCQIYVSNYGGGLVDGDHVGIKVNGLTGSRLYLGTQSSTKIYKSEGKGGCTQETVGVVHANALVVACPDPVVPFAGSKYQQCQSWEVHADGDLILFDWLQPGRMARGEVFQYSQLSTELRITRPGGVPILLERFDLEPANQNPLRCGQFGSFRSYLNIYMIGSRALELMEKLDSEILNLNKSGQKVRSANDANSESSPSLWLGLGKRDEEGCVIRALGGDRSYIQPLHDLIFAALADKAWLGFNPWERRW
jgi:urease accessory protein